jgi:hypothetical protein
MVGSRQPCHTQRVCYHLFNSSCRQRATGRIKLKRRFLQGLELCYGLLGQSSMASLQQSLISALGRCARLSASSPSLAYQFAGQSVDLV